MIRLARISDGDALEALARETFVETFVEDFAIPYPPEDLALVLAGSAPGDRFVDHMADPARAVWVAEQAGALVGYAMAGPCKLPHPAVAPGDNELQQLYVRRRAQGLGLGRLLLDGALAWLDARRPATQWLGVWSGNLRAQRVYAARGFVKVGEYRFPMGRGFDDDFLFRR